MKEHTKKIYIIRHGETDFNRDGIVQGSGVNSDLNDLGKKQADAFFEFYKYVPFNKIYTSTLKRTHQSVAKFLEKNIAWEQHEGLNEISWGTREGKLPDDADNSIFAEITNKWNKGNTKEKFEKGESPEEVAKRQAVFIEKMLEKNDENTILIAMHGRALKILLANIIQKDLSKMDEYEHSNLCLYVLNFNYITNSFSIETYKDTGHLILVDSAQ